MTLRDKLYEFLKRLSSENQYIKACGVATKPGLPLASAYPAMIEPGIVSAMISALMGVGQRASLTFENGILDTSIVIGKDGMLFLKMIGGEYILVVVTVKDVTIPKVMGVIDEFAKELKGILKEESRVVTL